MCLAQPISTMTAMYWNLVHSKNETEILMEKSFDEKEKYSEGNYITYMHLLKHSWGQFEYALPGVKSIIDKLQHAWFASGNVDWSPWVSDDPPTYHDLVIGMEKVLVKDEGISGNIDILGYFIKCAQRYKTRKFIKKLCAIRQMDDDELRNSEVMDALICVQDLERCGDYTFKSPDGRIYKWEILPYTGCWDMILQ